MNYFEVIVEDEDIKIYYSVGVIENLFYVKDIIWSKNGYLMYIEFVKFIGGGFYDSCFIINLFFEVDKGIYFCIVMNVVGFKIKFIVFGKFVLIMVVLNDYYFIIF